jgi:hypothetical protein
MGPGINLVDQMQVVQAWGPKIGTDTVGVEQDWISVKHVRSLEVIISVLNTITVTGSAVTLEQAINTAGGSAKALAMPVHYTNVDPANTSIDTRVNTTSNTFTTATTANATLKYRIPVDVATMDKSNGFDCFRVKLANAVNATIDAKYHVVPRYGGNASSMVNLVSE